MKKTISYFGALGILLTLFASCDRSEKPSTPSISRKVAHITFPTPQQISEFSRDANITFPISAKFISWGEQRGMDDALWLQVQISKKDFQHFLAHSPFHNTTLTTGNSYICGMFQDFYTTPPKHYRAGQERLPNARFINVLFDESATDDVMVYMMWSET